MNKRLLFLFVGMSLVSVQSFAAKERVVQFQNHVRFGYDDNINTSADNRVSSAYITEIAQLTAKAVFSSRTEALLYWQPELRSRFNAEPSLVSYQDLYLKLDHAISQRVFVTLSDRLRYQDREGQVYTGPEGLSTFSQNYLENDLKGALNITLTSKNQANFGAGYVFRKWDDDNYGQIRGNDFEQINADASFVRQLRKETSQGLLGVNFSDFSFDGSRGGYSSIAAFAGMDHIFSPSFSSYGRLGVQASTIDDGKGGTETDSSNPYFQAGFNHSASARTTFNGVMGYSLSRSDSFRYNAQDKFNIGLGVRHDITAKINLAANISCIYSYYDMEYSYNGLGTTDSEDVYTSVALRATYQVNRNNFIEAGYTFTHRSVDSDFLDHYNRNRVELGWMLRL